MGLVLEDGGRGSHWQTDANRHLHDLENLPRWLNGINNLMQERMASHALARTCGEFLNVVSEDALTLQWQGIICKGTYMSEQDVVFLNAIDVRDEYRNNATLGLEVHRSVGFVNGRSFSSEDRRQAVSNLAAKDSDFLNGRCDNIDTVNGPVEFL